MKKLLVALMLMGTLTGASYATDPLAVNRSSSVVAANSNGCITSSYLDGVIIGMASSGGVLELYNSSWTISSTLISSMSIATVGERHFNNVLVAGTCWKTSSNTNGVTILYKR